MTQADMIIGLYRIAGDAFGGIWKGTFTFEKA